MRAAFAAYAETHQPASIRRCWSTWNTLCTFLYGNDEIASNPMGLIGRPKVDKTLPKSFSADTVGQLLAVIDDDAASRRRSDWVERDRALLLTGLRADEMIRANIGDIRPTADGGVLHVRGKGRKDRRIPVETTLIDVIGQPAVRTCAQGVTQSTSIGCLSRPGGRTCTHARRADPDVQSALAVSMNHRRVC